jgi:mRNA interferase MazF
MKDFDNWNDLKKSIHNDDKGLTIFQERDVWWCSIGLNIGHEQDGKGDYFNRPVLVIKKFNNRLFWGVPLTTQIKDNKYYYRFTLKGKEQCVMLTHLRLYDAQRLTDRMNRLSENEFNEIKNKLAMYLQ